MIYEKDSTYSPLALYFLIDNNLIEKNSEINYLFDVLIEKTSLEKKLKILLFIKKHFIMQISSENELLEILNPINKFRKSLEITCSLFGS